MLDADAVQYFVTMAGNLKKADAEQAMLAAAKPPNVSCNPRLQVCGPIGVQSVLGGFATTTATIPFYTNISTSSGPMGPLPLTCRDISTTIRDLTPRYYNARVAYAAAAFAVVVNTLAVAGSSWKDVNGVWHAPEPFDYNVKHSLKEIVADATGAYGAGAFFDVAAEEFSTVGFQLDLLVVWYNSGDCNHQDWGPPPPPPPANRPAVQGGGSSFIPGLGYGATGGGGGTQCMYRQYLNDGTVVYEEVEYCWAV